MTSSIDDPLQPSTVLQQLPGVAALVTERGRAAARADLSAGRDRPPARRTPNPFPHNTTSATKAAMAAAWAAGYAEVDPPGKFDDSPPGELPPYRYPPPQ